MDLTLDTPLTDFPGVGPARAAKLEKLGLTRVRDLMTFSGVEAVKLQRTFTDFASAFQMLALSSRLYSAASGTLLPSGTETTLER